MQTLLYAIPAPRYLRVDCKESQTAINKTLSSMPGAEARTSERNNIYGYLFRLPDWFLFVHLFRIAAFKLTNDVISLQVIGLITMSGCYDDELFWPSIAILFYRARRAPGRVRLDDTRHPAEYQGQRRDHVPHAVLHAVSGSPGLGCCPVDLAAERGLWHRQPGVARPRRRSPRLVCRPQMGHSLVDCDGVVGASAARA